MLAMIYTWAATVIAFAGTILNCKQIRACFYLWTITNAMWFFWDISQSLYSRALLDVIQFGLAIWGVYEWRRLDDRRNSTNESRPGAGERSA